MKLNDNSINEILPLEHFEPSYQSLSTIGNMEMLDEFIVTNEDENESVSIQPELLKRLESSENSSKYKPIHLKDIGNVPREMYKYFPNSLVELIMNYIFVGPFGNPYTKTIERLRLSVDEKSKLNLCMNDFFNQFNLIMSSRKNDYENKFFIQDSSRLAFKNIIQIKNKLFNASDDKLEMISKDIQKAISMIHKPFSFISKFDLKTMDLNSFSLDLLNAEILEHYYTIVPRFIHVMEYFYLEDEVVSCKEFKDLFFPQSNGNPDTDILFKLFLNSYDYYPGLIVKCIENNSSYDLIKIPFYFKEYVRNDLEDLKSTGPNFFFLNDLGYLSDSIINVYILNGSRIWIKNYQDFINLLWKLEELEHLKVEMIESIVGFGSRGSLKWNQKKFVNYLYRCELHSAARSDDNILCCKCLKMFSQPLTFDDY